MVSVGTNDIFKSLGTDPGTSALYAIEPWCQQHPEERFGMGVVWLAETLRKNTSGVPVGGGRHGRVPPVRGRHPGLAGCNKPVSQSGDGRKSS
jgi:hypothetical protein